MWRMKSQRGEEASHCNITEVARHLHELQLTTNTPKGPHRRFEEEELDTEINIKRLLLIFQKYHEKFIHFLKK